MAEIIKRWESDGRMFTADETVKKFKVLCTPFVGKCCSTELSSREICSICDVPLEGFKCYLGKYYRHLMLARYGIKCTHENTSGIKLAQCRKQRPATYKKYKDAIAAYDSMEYIEYVV